MKIYKYQPKNPTPTEFHASAIGSLTKHARNYRNSISSEDSSGHNLDENPANSIPEPSTVAHDHQPTTTTGSTIPETESWSPVVLSDTAAGSDLESAEQESDDDEIVECDGYERSDIKDILGGDFKEFTRLVSRCIQF